MGKGCLGAHRMEVERYEWGLVVSRWGPGPLKTWNWSWGTENGLQSTENGGVEGGVTQGYRGTSFQNFDVTVNFRYSVCNLA